MRSAAILITIATTFLLSCSKSDKSNKPVYPTECANYLAGAYTGSDYCAASGPSSYPATVIASTSTEIIINYLYGAQVTAQLDCTNNTITIPSQTFAGNLSLSGSGTYTANRIIINWTGTTFGVPLSCSTTYTR